MTALRTNRYLPEIAALAVVYAMVGKLGLLLAIPPGYASAVFPAAGVAVAAVLHGGNRLLPGVWLGSFVLNVWVAFGQGRIAAYTVLIAAGIALGSTLQTWLAAFLVRRRPSCQNLRLEDERSIFEFLILAGPVACLLSASWGVSTLVLSGAILPAMSLYSWWNWWVGDTLGVMVFAPLTLMLLRRRESIWDSRTRNVLPIMLAVTAGVMALFVYAAGQERDRLENNLRITADTLSALLKTEVATHHEIVSSLARFLAINPNMTYSQFEIYVREALSRHPDILGLSWNPIVKDTDRPGFEKRMAQETAGGLFRIVERDAGLGPVPAAVRPEYVPVTYIAPLNGNQEAVGFDIASDAVRFEALQRANVTGVPAATPPIHLVQAKGGEDGFLLMEPVLGGSSAQGKTRVGYAAGAFEIRKMVEHTIGNKIEPGLAFQLSLHSAGKDADAFYRSVPGNATIPTDFISSVDVPVGGLNWQLMVFPTPDYLESHRPLQAWLVLATGLLVASLLQAMLLGMTGRAAVIQRRVDERTRELLDSEQRLKTIIDASPVPFALNDEQQNITYLNAAFTNTFGYDLQDIPTLADWWPKAYPDPEYRRWIATSWQNRLEEARRENTPFRPMEIRIRCKDGTDRTVIAGVSALEQSYRGTILVSLYDISVRTTMEAVLRSSEMKLRGLYELSPLGIALVDTDGRIVEYNESFQQLIGYTGEELRQLNYWELTPEKYADEDVAHRKLLMSNGHYGPYEKEYIRKDGGVVSVRVNGMLVKGEDGRNHIWSIVEDITERKRAETEYRKLVQAVEQSPMSIVITDLEGSIEYVNPAFCQVTGYRYEEALGKNPRILKSGETSDAEYRKMWNTLISGKPWSGIFHNKRKDGSLYWEQAHIAPVFDEQGRITHYLAVKENITERKATEDALHEASLYARSLIEASLDPLVTISPEGKITDVNQATEKVTGYSRDELIGTDFSDYFTDPDMARKGYHAAFTKEYVTDYPLTIHHRDGHLVDVLYNASVFRDQSGRIQGVFAAARDVTERKIIEDALRENRQQLVSMLENSPIAVRIAASGGSRVLFANKRYEELINVAPGQVIGANPKSYYANPQDYEDVLELIATGEVVTNLLIELNIPGKGTTWAMASYMPMEYQGEPAVLGWFYDVNDLMRAQELAQEAGRLKSEFLANMSHEIRTPMNAIIGLSQLALNREVSPEVRDYLEKIRISSDSLLVILNDILDFSKIEAGRMTIEHVDFDLDAVLDNLNNICVVRAEEKFLDFNLDVAPDVPRHLVGDELRLQQILVNLVGNAIKFTEHGQVTLQISLLGLEKTQARLRFTVEDTGIGMSEEDQEKLFQPFTQADGSITRRFGGTGLGLAISNNLLHLMGGTFHVESAPGKGTKFSFELALGIATQAMERDGNRRKEQRKAGALSAELRELGHHLAGARVLVAEDNPINQQVVREFLQLSGVTVEIASNGKQALELLEKEQFHAVLMDVHMPEMGGVEASRLIRAQPRFSDLPIIALTAGVTKEERDNCRACGMNDFVAKPINPDELITTLLSWLTYDEESLPAAKEQPLKAEGSVDLDNLPGFDLANLLTMLGGDTAMVVQLLCTFRDDNANLLPDLEAKLAANDYDAAKRLVHTIKGTAGNLGATKLHAAAEALDAGLRLRVLDQKAYTAFRHALKEALAVLAKLASQ